jgi:hypothetical protein
MVNHDEDTTLISLNPVGELAMQSCQWVRIIDEISAQLRELVKTE